MEYFQQVILAVLAVVLYVLVNGARAQDPEEQVPISVPPQMDPRTSMFRRIGEVVEQMVKSNTGIFVCVMNHFNTTALEYQIRTEFSGDMTGENFNLYTRVAMEIFCRDYANPFLTCLDKTITSGSSKLDVILQKVLDFPRLHALVKYGCSKINVLSSNMVCVQKKVEGIMSSNSTQHQAVTTCLKKVDQEAAPMTYNENLQVDEKLLKRMMRLPIEYVNCMKPAMEGCGEYSKVFYHMTHEMTLMYSGEKMGNPSSMTTGKTILFPLLAMASSVFIGLKH